MISIQQQNTGAASIDAKHTVTVHSAWCCNDFNTATKHWCSKRRCQAHNDSALCLVLQ